MLVFMSKKKRITWEIIAIIFILVAAFFLRFNNLSWETYGYGEVELKQAAEEYVKGNFVNNFYIFDTPPLSKYLFALSIAALGSSEFALRIISLIFGMLAILAVYLTVKRIYNTNTALFTSAVTAFSILQIEFSRYAQLETMLTLFYILIVYFLWSAVNEKKHAFIFLGISLGIALAIKFSSLIVLATVIIYAIYARQIRFSIRPNFSISVKNWLLKALIIALVVFAVSWPFGFSKLHTEADISVNYGVDVRVQHIESDIPTMLLSFSRRIFSSVDVYSSYPPIMAIPVLNYFLLFAIKESLLVLALLFIGLYFTIKNPLKQDALVITFILTFLLLMSFQKTFISYRHITPLVPFFGIIASRPIGRLKNSRQIIAIIAAALILFAYAAFSGPSYALSYNPLKNILGLPDSEFRFSEGMKETISYATQNCSSVFTSGYYKFMMEPYYKKFSLPAECAVKGISGADVVDEYIGRHNCTLAKTVSTNSIKLVEIYSC